MTKTRQDNDMTYHINAVYVEKNIKQSWLIRLGVDRDKN